MSSSEANLSPANNSIVIEDVYNNNNEIADTNDEIFIPDKINITDNNIFKKFMQNQLEEVIRKKKKFYELKNFGNKDSDPIATNNNTKTGETKWKYPDGTAVIIGNSILNGIIKERLSRKGRTIKVHNFRGAAVDDMKHRVIPLLC